MAARFGFGPVLDGDDFSEFELGHFDFPGQNGGGFDPDSQFFNDNDPLGQFGGSSGGGGGVPTSPPLGGGGGGGGFGGGSVLDSNSLLDRLRDLSDRFGAGFDTSLNKFFGFVDEGFEIENRFFDQAAALRPGGLQGQAFTNALGGNFDATNNVDVSSLRALLDSPQASLLSSPQIQALQAAIQGATVDPLSDPLVARFFEMANNPSALFDANNAVGLSELRSLSGSPIDVGQFQGAIDTATQAAGRQLFGPGQQIEQLIGAALRDTRGFGTASGSVDTARQNALDTGITQLSDFSASRAVEAAGFATQLRGAQLGAFSGVAQADITSGRQLASTALTTTAGLAETSLGIQGRLAEARLAEQGDLAGLVTSADQANLDRRQRGLEGLSSLSTNAALTTRGQTLQGLASQFQTRAGFESSVFGTQSQTLTNIGSAQLQALANQFSTRVNALGSLTGTLGGLALGGEEGLINTQFGLENLKFAREQFEFQKEAFEQALAAADGDCNKAKGIFEGILAGGAVGGSFGGVAGGIAGAGIGLFGGLFGGC